MSTRTARLLLFLTIALTAPAPMGGPFDALVPVARYLLLFAATAGVALAEGTAGPIPAILALFGVHALGYALLAALAAWAAARALAPLPPRARGALVLACCGALLAAALVFDLYRTPFGRTPSGNLWSVLS